MLIGLTYGSNQYNEGDNHITLAVEVGMTDHPAATPSSSHNLNLVISVGSSEIEVPYPIQVLKDGSESVSLNAVININTTKVFQRGYGIFNLKI